MRSLRVLVIVLALVCGGWMVFDGARALVVGDYVTPRTGPYAGQLGPWAGVVQAIGIPPRSTAMKAIFVAAGLIWLVAALGVARRRVWASSLMLGIAAATLWYLPVGTVLSIVVLVAMSVLVSRSRRLAS